MPLLLKGDKKLIRAWATYDLANSVYNLVITATIFPIYYNAVTTEKNDAGEVINNTVNFLGISFKNTALYEYSLAFAYLVVVLFSPLLSGVADYGGSKKKFMQIFSYMGAGACLLMFFFDKDSVSLGIILAIVACMGYSGSMVFYNAYLPEIAYPEQQDKVSAKGFSMGYWGSSILLVINLVMIKNYEMFHISSAAEATRISFLTVGIWWAGFAQIPFYYLPKGEKINHKRTTLANGYHELMKVWNELKHNKQLKRYLAAFFIYSMGVQTVMLVATLFGSTEIKDTDGSGMDSGKLITVILIIQFVAMGGAHLFSYISRKAGNLLTLKIATVFWAIICALTYALVYTPMHFYLVAMGVGLVMGGIQSLSRSTYSKMLPETYDHTSYFSFYDVCEKMSIVLGMACFALITENSSTMRTPILILVLFFLVGFLLLFRVPQKENNE
ncbi:MAG: MFS transporter [Bacteroidia bacterium]|nr:MFS transporter [Bacteroidia bacterium]MCZ2247314.1 MFS transporter [Bacteroidia bacterium]